MAVRREPAAEERELRALVAADPGNTKALERLAVLMVGSGRVEGIRGAGTAARRWSTAPTTRTARPSSTVTTSRAAQESWPS